MYIVRVYATIINIFHRISPRAFYAFLSVFVEFLRIKRKFGIVYSELMIKNARSTTLMTIKPPKKLFGIPNSEFRIRLTFLFFYIIIYIALQKSGFTYPVGRRQVHRARRRETFALRAFE